MNGDDKLSLKRVETFDDAEILRQVRNSCREFMTRNQNFISKEQQEAWFTDLVDLYPYLVYANYSRVVGYGLIHKNDDCALITGGLIPVERGQGKGVELFTLLINEAKEYHPCVRLEVLESNIRARKVYENLGFKIIGETDTIYSMELYEN